MQGQTLLAEKQQKQKKDNYYWFDHDMLKHPGTLINDLWCESIKLTSSN
jgi:hypothetical protein